MGTDIYLYKKGHKKTEGYLRAGIFQERENGLLRMLFPNKYWDVCLEEGGGEQSRYEFTDEGFETLTKIGRYYEDSVIHGTDFKRFSHPAKEQILQGHSLMEQPGYDNNIVFLEKVYAFYRKGLELESKGSNPEVYISW